MLTNFYNIWHTLYWVNMQHNNYWVAHQNLKACTLVILNTIQIEQDYLTWC